MFFIKKREIFPIKNKALHSINIFLSIIIDLLFHMLHAYTAFSLTFFFSIEEGYNFFFLSIIKRMRTVFLEGLDTLPSCFILT